jgi:hypothetical protein
MLETNTTNYASNINGASPVQVGSGEGSYTSSNGTVTGLVSQVEYSYASAKSGYASTLSVNYNTPTTT